MSKIVNGLRDLKESLELVNKLSKRKECTILSSDFNVGQKILLSKAEKGFKFSMTLDEPMFKHEQWDFSNVIIEDGVFKFMEISLYASNKEFHKIEGSIGNIYSQGFDRKREFYYKLIIPVSSRVDFTFSIENVIVEYLYKSKIRTRNAVEVDIEEEKFLLYGVNKKASDNQNCYIVLESNSRLCFEKFAEIAYSILIGFGFVTGSFIQGEGFFFQYETHLAATPIGFYHTIFRDSMKCDYVPINSNPHSYIHDSTRAKEYENLLRTLSLKEFSHLCTMIHTVDDFKSITLLIMESNLQSLLSSPGIMSICLETLAGFYFKENEKLLAPIKKSGVAKKVRQFLKQGLKSFYDDIDNEGMKVLNNRIDNINQVTNAEKLLIPFKVLDIELNEEDIEAIKQRNAFLHGRTPKITDVKLDKVAEEDKLRYYLYLKYYTLVSAIILKECGFDNRILNYPKIYENYTGVKLEEKMYRPI